ncbi:MAG: hypothetical protein QW040_00480 [Candidatus Aenigmatarchaeota archaeon]
MKVCLLFLSLLIIVIFISGCISQEEKKVAGVGLSSTLTVDVKEVKASTPMSFILTVKNLASEAAEDISVHLTNLTDWKIENEIQRLESLPPNDLYKFSWVAYAPQQNGIFIPTSNIFYFMKTRANLKIRVYDNEYLNTLKQEERVKIKERSAVLSYVASKNTPITIQVSLQQPFILTRYKETFSFVLEIKNVGLGEVYSELSTYPPYDGSKDYLTFEFNGNATIECDYESYSLIKLSNNSKNIVCRVIVTKDELDNYVDFSIDFVTSYKYLDKATTKIEVK